MTMQRSTSTHDGDEPIRAACPVAVTGLPARRPLAG